MELLYELQRVANANRYATKQCNKTVEAVNENAVNLAADIIAEGCKPLLIGVKNTGQIDRKIFARLCGDRITSAETGDSYRCIFHTVDKMAHGGRAVDHDLVNPLTLRAMSGSSSGTAINVLLGINDIGVGTDGGGSVLAPALALNLYGIMAKGMGLKGSMSKKSTDGIEFVPGVGLLGKDLAKMKNVLQKMLGAGVAADNVGEKKLRVGLPKRGWISLADGRDMRQVLYKWKKTLEQCEVEIVEVDLPDCYNREEAMAMVSRIWHHNIADVLLTYEGPVDFCGYGDSMLGCMGSVGAGSQIGGGKHMLKVANMLDATAVTLPDNEAACGALLIAKPGVENGWRMLKLANELATVIKLPDLYCTYWGEYVMKKENSFIFAL